jgi:hypothetical protein
MLLGSKLWLMVFSLIPLRRRVKEKCYGVFADPETLYIESICKLAWMTRAGDLPETKLPGIWSPQELGTAVGYSRQTIIDAIHGRGKYPRKLFAQKTGDLWLIPDEHADVFMHWHRTGELLEEPPIPARAYLCVKEIAEMAEISTRSVERAISGHKKGTYSYPPTLQAQKLGQHWLVEATDAERYIQAKREKSGRERGG